MKINADEVMRAIERREEIDRIPLAEIEWVNDAGEPIAIDPEKMAEWKYIGMSNTSFVELAIFGEWSEVEIIKGALHPDNLTQ